MELFWAILFLLGLFAIGFLNGYLWNRWEVRKLNRQLGRAALEVAGLEEILEQERHFLAAVRAANRAKQPPVDQLPTNPPAPPQNEASRHSGAPEQEE